VPESPAKLAGLRRECGDGIISRPGCVGGGTWLPPWRGGESDSRSQGWLAWKRRRRLVGRQRHNGDKTNSRIEAFLGIHLFFPLLRGEDIHIFHGVYSLAFFFVDPRASLLVSVGTEVMSKRTGTCTCVSADFVSAL
jgi:hypothetical protein